MKIPFEIQTRLKTKRSVSKEKPEQSNPTEDQKRSRSEKNQSPVLKEKPSKSKPREKTNKIQIQKNRPDPIQRKPKTDPDPKEKPSKSKSHRVQIHERNLTIRNPPAK